MITFDDMLNEQMNDEEFRKEYEAIKSEMDAIRKIVDSRNSKKCTLSGKLWILVFQRNVLQIKSLNFQKLIVHRKTRKISKIDF